MDTLEFLSDEDILEFFRCKRTEMSCMEKPHIFLSQLRDYNLIPEEMYKELMRKRSKEQREKGLYKMLTWLEEKRFDCIRVFWRCVFKDHLLKEYSTLRQLRQSLLPEPTSGSFKVYEELAEKVEKKEKEVKGKKRKTSGEGEEVVKGKKRKASGKGEEEVKGKKRKASGEGEEEVKGKKRNDSGEEEVKKKKKTVSRKRKMSKGNESSEEEEQPSTSTQTTPSQKKKVQKPVFSSLKKGETADIWNLPSYKTQLPITCADKKATLYREKMTKGVDCILSEDQWFTLTGFEEFGGMKSCKKWKTSICCEGTTLEKLIQEGNLTVPGLNGRKVGKSKRELFPSDQSAVTSSEHEDQEEDTKEEEAGQEKEGGEQSPSSGGRSSPGSSSPGRSPDVPQTKVFQVTCGVTSGMLIKKRFASGTRGKCIRTEQSWMTPEEFLSEGSNMTESSWTKNILWDGKPLRLLIENKFLEIHSLLCECLSCNPTAKDLQDQKNDDDCFTCRSPGSLICCEECPRSFHQECHLPNVEDALLGNDLPWVCTFCKLRDRLSWLYPSQNTYQEVLSFLTSKHLLECQYLLLYLYHEDKDHIFVKDPCIKVRNYSSVIKTPMWLYEVARKLQDGQYQTLKPFVSDLLLIFTNCATFNRDNSEIREMGKRLNEQFEREFKKTFSVQLQ